MATPVKRHRKLSHRSVFDVRCQPPADRMIVASVVPMGFRLPPTVRRWAIVHGDDPALPKTVVGSCRPQREEGDQLHQSRITSDPDVTLRSGARFAITSTIALWFQNSTM
jgi:hypothetical protein